jgi:uncharacterized protein (UPF0548 family)
MFMIRKPSPAAIAAFLSSERGKEFSYSEVGSTGGTIPQNYTVDHNRVRLGSGAAVFLRAVESVRAWRMFRLGWVQLFEPDTRIEAGATVAVLVHHFGFWSLNACRVVYVREDARKYSFAYGTLQDHAEQGEERFSVEWSAQDDSVSYDILAFSRPRQWQAKLARPLSRTLQRKFARDSMAAMKREVNHK